MLKKSKNAVFVIDMQNDFVLPDLPGRYNTAHKVVPAIQNILEFAREKSWPVFHIVREYREDGSDIENTRLNDFISKGKAAVPGTFGCEIVKELKPVDGEYRIVKPRFSGFMGTELDFMLRRFGVENVIICGTQIPNCVRATAFDAVSYEYNVTVIEDAISAKSEEVAAANIIDMKNIGINFLTVNQLIQYDEDQKVA
ncbi:MAG: isochorismatase [Alphaproteobacteria bacterium]|nr:MAG: isochorismatase [Alphaproteobacteria bacterium]